MTASPLWSIHCDVAGCGQWTAETATAGEARDTARRRGWIRVSFPGETKDLCPPHAREHRAQVHAGKQRRAMHTTIQRVIDRNLTAGVSRTPGAASPT